MSGCDQVPCCHTAADGAPALPVLKQAPEGALKICCAVFYTTQLHAILHSKAKRRERAGARTHAIRYQARSTAACLDSNEWSECMRREHTRAFC